MATQLAPFLLGTRGVWRKIAQIPVTPGLAAPTTKIPKYGWLSSMRYRIAGSVTVGTAGTAGTPNLQNIINSLVLSLSGNYQYRNLDGERMILKNQLQVYAANDPVFASPSYANYSPTTAAAQNVSLPFEDNISLNSYENADEFLLAAQARNYDITLDVTFNPLASVVANTEVISGTNLVLYVEGYYFLDPDYSQFEQPDTGMVQQCLKDDSFTNVVVGDNTIPIVPINGPQLIGLAVKPVFNGVADTPGYGSSVTNFRLRVNNGQDIIDIPASDLAAHNFQRYGRRLTSTPLTPSGWYYFDFLDDTSDINAATNGPSGPMYEKALSTATLSALDLIATVASGTTVTNSVFKLFKRYRNPAVNAGG